MDELKKGTRLKGRYEILSPLGQGGFGCVYKALDTLLNCYVAIKVSDKSLSPEAEILKALKDVPYISHMYEHFKLEGKSFIVMRLVSGESLASYHRSLGHALNVSLINEWLPYICMSLYQMHKAGIIHRDLSPGNLMLTPEGALYLIDFGTATSLKNESLKNLIIFSHAGLDAPERADHENLGPGTDIYSLCATIVYLLSEEGIPACEDRLKYDPLPSILSRLSLNNRQQNALLKGLHVDINRRYDDVTLFLRDFTGLDMSSPDARINYNIYYTARTDIGRRPVNQDNFMLDGYFSYAGEDCCLKGDFPSDSSHLHIVALADGVAGSSYGDFASKAAIQAVSHFLDAHKYDPALPSRLLEDLFDQINEKILALSKKIGATATTLSVLMWKDGSYYLANVGDSPIYMQRDNKLCRLTHIHTVSEEKKKTGAAISPRDLHTLTRFLGKNNSSGSQMAYFTQGQLREGDKFLICSDGISQALTEENMNSYMKKEGSKALSLLWKKANKNPSMDNCTAIILEFKKF